MKKGFTLVELLIVIAIMGILTSITVAQFVTAKKKANDVARKGDLNATSKALQMYFNDYGKFPDQAAIVWGTVFQDSATPPYVYMAKLPKENYTTTPYYYQVSADGKKYALFAKLENIVDRECTGSYVLNTKTYCYAITSPNTSLTSLSDATFK